jgi:SpoVK/Ycf46/Vps4 family AAA+-type ATPase
MATLERILNRQLEQLPRGGSLSPKPEKSWSRQPWGWTQDEAEKVYRKAVVMHGRLSEAEVDIILSEKKQIIRRNGILEFIEEDESIDAVGGLEELKRWFAAAFRGFTERARAYGLPAPKGLLILGVPGCGKSLIAQDYGLVSGACLCCA